jgi:hypothetical protein
MRTKHALTALALATGLALGVTAPADAARAPLPGCPGGWGSLEKSDPGMSGAHITNVRSGRHTCFDRLVVDLDGPVDGWNVRYVPEVTEDGSGASVPLRGGAFIEIVVRSPAYDDNGNATYRPANRRELVSTRNFRTFRQVAFAGTFEGVTTFGLGVRARLPMRVMVLSGPGTGSRLVIDVAHRW